MRKRATAVFIRAGSALVVAAAMVVATPALARPAPAVPPGGLGFGDGAAMLTMSIDDVNRELDAVTKTSASWLRLPVDWARIETAKGAYDWSYLDALVGAAQAHGLKIMGTIAYSADWARPPGSFMTTLPDNPAEYASFAAAAASRYAGRIVAWQVWNEPNLPLFSGYTIHNGARYTALLKAAYPAIKGAAPGATVVAAGLSRLPGDDSPPAFLQQMYAAGVKGFFDAAAGHPYVFPGGLAADTDNGWSDIGRMRDVMVTNGDGGKKIWMTELGAPTSDPSAEGVSQAEQAKQITDVLAAIAGTGYSGPAFIYSIRDLDSNNRGDREANFGALLTSDFQPKAAAAALAR